MNVILMDVDRKGGEESPAFTHITTCLAYQLTLCTKMYSCSTTRCLSDMPQLPAGQRSIHYCPLVLNLDSSISTPFSAITSSDDFPLELKPPLRPISS